MVAKIGTPFFIILLVGAIVGFFYVMAGGTPLFDFFIGERPSYFFPWTCSPLYIGNFIRPSGIYDEPGAFSMFLCILVVFRVLTGKNDILTYVMLLAGCITMSVAHMVFFAFYNVYLLGRYRKNVPILVCLAIIMFGIIHLLLQNQELFQIFDEKLFARLQGDQITENNRTRQIPACLKILETHEMDRILFGEPDWLKDVVAFGTDIYTNPLGPLVVEGLLISWVYYLCMVFLLLGGLLSKKYRFIFWGIMLVFAQRPYYLLTGYSTAFYIFAFIAATIKNDEIKGRRIKNSSLGDVVDYQYGGYGALPASKR
jgi:hypothetical protein